MSRLVLTVVSVCLIEAFVVPAAAQDAVERIASAIDWKAAGLAQKESGKSAENARKTLLANSPDELDGMKLPVLILGTDGDWGSPRFRGQGTAYVAAYAAERAKLSVLGSASKIIAPKGLQFEHEAAAFELIGHGADYSFVRYGASYTLRLTCDEPLKDKRCTDPQYLTSIANALVIVGGKP